MEKRTQDGRPRATRSRRELGAPALSGVAAGLAALGLCVCNAAPTSSPPSALPKVAAKSESHQPVDPPSDSPSDPPSDPASAQENLGPLIPPGLSAPTLEHLLAGSCSIDGEVGVVAADGTLPKTGAELWLVTRTGVFAGEVTGIGGCDAEQLADPEEAVHCPEPWAVVAVEGELSCGESYTWAPDPGLVADFPGAPFFIAVPRTVAPPTAPRQSLELHLAEARCEAQGEEEDDASIVVMSSPSWDLRPGLDVLLPRFVGAPRRAITLIAEGEDPLHALAATLDDAKPRQRSAWALVAGRAEPLRLLATREEQAKGSKGKRSAGEHLLDHSCRTPYLMAPTPALLFRLAEGSPALLLTADERSGDSIRMELWQIDPTSASLRHTFPSELFSPKF